LLPDVDISELEKIIQKTKEYCLGYYSGPTYLKKDKLTLLDDIPNNQLKLIQPSWMPNGNEFFQVEKAGQMEELKKLVEKSGKNLFSGAAEGIQYLKKV